MKKLSRRIMALGLCSCMIFSAAGCGDKEEQNTDEPASSSSVNRDIDYGEVHEPRSFEGIDVCDSTIYVEPIEGITDDFIRGVDVSSYLAEKDSGVKYYDYDGNELDDAGFFNFLADSGVNWVRVRIWNDPYDSSGNGYGGGNSDLDKAIAIGKLATNAGMKVLIDFHYSDFWADPSKQYAPKDWAHMTFDNKVTALGEYTTESLEKLIDAGVNVGMVQMGNETNSGMAGETSEERVYTLMKTASEAIRSVSEAKGMDILIAVHYTNPDSSSFPEIAGKLIDAGVDFDVFGTSYYPYWHGTLEKLTNNLSAISEQYGKKVMVAETSYIYTNDDGDGFANTVSIETDGVTINYDISVQGQANEVRDVMQAVINIGEAGLGVFYWEPAWIPVNVVDDSVGELASVTAANTEAWETYGSGWASSYSAKYDPNDAGIYYGGASWDNQALFDFYGHPLESLNIFKYVFSGTNLSNEIVSVPDVELNSGINNELVMPETVNAVMLDSSRQAIPVVWDESDIAGIDVCVAGDYQVKGVATGEGKDYDLVCTVHILKINYIQNGGFEEDDYSMWKIVGDGVDREQDNNKRTGDYSIKFYSTNEVNWYAEQTIANIPAGTYELSGYVQGGDAGSNAVFELYITVNGVELTASAGVSSWQNWENPVISNIEIPEGAEVVVGIRVQADPLAWGSWDDFTLYQMD